jgi:glycosidase
MRRFVEAMELEFPRLTTVGEIWALEPAYISQYQKGSPLAERVGGHLPAVMDFPLMDVYRRYIQGTAELKDIYEKLATDFVYGDPNMLVTFLENHDTQRAIYIADHKTERLKIALHLLLTTRGIPQLLYGSEINMFGGPRHVDLRADFPGGFPGDQRNAFTKSGRTENENGMFDFIRKLLHLRKNHRALSLGSLTHFPPIDNTYIHIKQSDDQTILCIANGNAASRVIDLSRIKSRIPPGAKLVDLRTDSRYLASDGIPLEPMQTILLEVN